MDNHNHNNAPHWLTNEPRNRGLGDLVLCVNHIAIIVADVGRSCTFYTDVLGLQQLKRPNFDRHGAWLTVGNVELHLIKGTPLVHTGENLIVSHIALDVSDTQKAFARLREMQVPFEVNVSVPKGQGKAESEGGGRDNTLSQAFLRDPDGYYIELCNCDILTDFALGVSNGLVDNQGTEVLASYNIMSSLSSSTRTAAAHKAVYFCSVRLLCAAARAKRQVQQRRKCHRCLEAAKQALTRQEQKEPRRCCPTTLQNFAARQQVYGDICQSFNETEMHQLLLEASNNAPMAILLMMDAIYKGQKKRVFYPPAYYVEVGNLLNTNNKFTPAPMEAAVRRSTQLSIMTAGLRSLRLHDDAALNLRRQSRLSSTMSLGLSPERQASLHKLWQEEEDNDTSEELG